MAGYREKPVAKPTGIGKPCAKCGMPFAPEIWKPSKWTLSGWSPWCPGHHREFSGQKEEKVRRGRKPKVNTEVAWTNLPS
jgi:hypothetical protein